MKKYYTHEYDTREYTKTGVSLLNSKKQPRIPTELSIVFHPRTEADFKPNKLELQNNHDHLVSPHE